MLRVTRVGGVVVIVCANPYPLLFPIRVAIHFVAGLPLIGRLLRKMRKSKPLPYRPMSINWYKLRLKKWGKIAILAYGLPSTKFNQNITEFKGIGRLMWKIIRWLDLNYAKLSAYLGNYILISVEKKH